ncbi:MAG: hypothetical protein CSA26_05370 [Desulfobacterales bacterium]|nr:MAG: hypothetical protein CSA26_05370 [Desulfobacterales bacterium]
MFRKNALWQFLASVKLALVTIFFIAATSIIGTIIPQKQELAWYSRKFGEQTAHFFQLLNLTDMYSSWWFISLLVLLGINLVICSLDRFPATWKQITADGTLFKKGRLSKMPFTASWKSDAPVDTIIKACEEQLKKQGWTFQIKRSAQTTLIFSQKNAWSRTGVYIVHLSILVVFLGGIIGAVFGFKGSILIPEIMERDGIVIHDEKRIHKLGFTVRCNFFTIDFHANGMPREYTSELTVIEDGKEVVTREIEVNKPLTYKGITFYQSSYRPYQKDFVIIIKNNKTGARKVFISPFQKKISWPEEKIACGIINAEAINQSIVRTKIWFKQEDQNSSAQWSKDNSPVLFQTANASYTITAKQRYATGLQVAKDPGVWWVYLGFGLMLFGLYVSFFLSHKRIWLLVSKNDERNTIQLFGTANKNQPGFEKVFNRLVETIQSD